MCRFVSRIQVHGRSDKDLKGANDWAPSHAAAARNDVSALKLFVKYGANLKIRTNIDEYATPLEEALILSEFMNCADAIQYLISLK